MFFITSHLIIYLTACSIIVTRILIAHFTFLINCNDAMSHLLIVKRLEQYMDLPLYKINILLLLLLLLFLNDRIATQRYVTPEIPIGSPVISRTTSELSGGRARKMVAIVSGYRSFRTFRDCHTSIAFTTVGAQPNWAHIFG